MKEQLNTLNQFENGVFQIEREGKIIRLTQKEIYRFRYLEMALIGRNRFNSYLDIADTDEIEIIEKIRKDEKLCHNIEENILEVLHEDCGDTETEYIQGYIKKAKEKFLQ